MNVTGTIDRGAMTTDPAGEPRDPHMVAAMLDFTDASGREVRASVSGDGSFALHLEPGRYTITAAPPPFASKVEPSTVQVPKRTTVHLALRIVRST